MKRNRKSKTALLCFLLCIPLILIGYFVYVFMNEKVSAEEVSKVIVSGEHLETITYEDDDSIDFYVYMVLNASKLSTPLPVEDESDAVTLTLDRGNNVVSYTIYPELSESGCMFRDKNDVYYMISGSDAEKMLSRKEFAYLYKKSALPALKIISGTSESEIYPVSYEWFYKKQNGSFEEYKDTPIYSSENYARIYSDRSNSLEFAKSPDKGSYSITITDSKGNELDTDELSDLVYINDTWLHISISANWMQTGSSDSYGNAKYEFDLLYDIPAQFSLSSTDVSVGGFVTLSVRYLNDDEKVYISSELKTNELHFTENEGLKTAVLGIDDSNYPGVYDVYCTVGDNESSFRLNVSGPAQAERQNMYRLPISEELYEKTLGETGKSELDYIMNEVISSLGTYTYSSPEFSSPASGELIQEYGTMIIATIDNTANTHLHYAIGNTYADDESTGIYAAAKGRVIYSGHCETLGNLIVIDHGSGVCTWYYGLSEIKRGVGTEVASGSILGFSGKDVYTSTSCFGFCVSAGNVFIKPVITE